jgi:hypothetical protein
LGTTIIGARLQDENEDDFLVISVPWERIATLDGAGETFMAFSNFRFPKVFPSRHPDGRRVYLGDNSLTAICESRLGQNPNWQEILVSFERESE